MPYTAGGGGGVSAQGADMGGFGRGVLAFAELADQRENRAKAEAEMGKSADAFMKAQTLAGDDPWSKLGLNESEYYNLRPHERAGAAKGLMMAQTYADMQAQAAERKAEAGRRMAADEADAQVGPAIGYAADRLSPSLTTPDLQQYYDTTSAEQPAPIATGPAAMTREQAIAAAMQRYPAAAGSRNFNDSWKALMDYAGADGGKVTEGKTSFNVPWAMHNKTIQFFPQVNAETEGPKEDPSGKFYWSGKGWVPKKAAAEPGEAPITSPDGKFYWSGSRWVGVKEEDPFKAAVASIVKGGKTNAPAAKPAAATTARPPEQQSVLDDFKAGKLSREAAKVKLKALGLD